MSESVKITANPSHEGADQSESVGKSFSPPAMQLTASPTDPALPGGNPDQEAKTSGPNDQGGDALQLQERSTGVGTVTNGPIQKQDGLDVDSYKGQDVNKSGRVSCPQGQYEIASTEGVKLRNKPNGALDHVGRVKYNTEVRVRCFDNTGGFYFVVPLDGSPPGWINKDYVRTDVPEPGATLHHVTEPDLTTIMKRHYVDSGKWSMGSGNDYTSLAAAIQSVNQGKAGVFIDWKKVEEYKQNNKLRGTLDRWTFDNFAIYAGSDVKAGHNIWLPSVSYIKMLQDSGAVSTRPDLLNFAIDAGKGVAGFLAGVVEGLFKGLWEMVEGLWELGKGIVNTIKGLLDGSLFASIGELYDKAKNFTWEDAERMVNDIITMASGAWNDFKESWNHPNIYSKWNFRGVIVGKVALEVILAIFTGGASLGAKVLAKVGKYFPKLMKVMNKLLKHADDIDFRKKKDRKNGDRDHKDDDRDGDNSSREWEQTRMMASVMVEGHDKKDTPVATLIPLLNTTFAAKSKSVSRYKAQSNGDGSHKILQLAKKNVVDEHYTEGESEGGVTKASSLPVIRRGSPEWDKAVRDLRNLGKGKMNVRVESATDAKALLTESRGNMNRYKQYAKDDGVTYKKGYEVHNDQNPRELGAGNDLQHIKWKDGKAGGHIYYNTPN